MDKENKQLKNNQKPKVNSKKKIIYVFRALNTDLTLYKVGRTLNSKTRFNKHNSPLANDIEPVFQFETDNIEQVEMCVKAKMKKSQYRKYKEVFEVDLDIIKSFIKNCDAEIKSANRLIEKKNIKQKGGTEIPLFNETTKYYMFIPKDKINSNEKKLSKKSSKNF